MIIKENISKVMFGRVSISSFQGLQRPSFGILEYEL